MEITSAVYNEDQTVINAVIDGINMAVPVDTANRHYVAILNWVENEDGVIDPYVAPPEPIPSVISSRQFMVYLDATGLYDDVVAWVNTQERAVQLAFNNSATFNRNEPMLQAGFDAMGFTVEQIDSFFLAASKI